MERWQYQLPGFEGLLQEGATGEKVTSQLKTDPRDEWFSQPRKIIESEHPDIASEADVLLGRLQTVEGYARLARGLMCIAMVGQSWRLKALATVGVDMAIDKGVTWNMLLEILEPGRTKVVEMDQLGSMFREGRPPAFMHGHFRMVTPTSLSTVVVAGELAAGEGRDLIVGREVEQRTREYKTDEIIYPEEEINDIFLDAGLCKWLLRIRDIPYSNAGYRQLLEMIRPGMYFSTSEYSHEVRQERQLRAESVGARYLELDPGPRNTTSDLLVMGMLRDVNYKPDMELPMLRLARWGRKGGV